MPLKINGTTIPLRAVGFAAVGIFWLAGLSFQVAANNSSIATHVPADRVEGTEVKERLATIEANQTANKEDIKEIKAAQQAHDEKLDRILKAVE